METTPERDTHIVTRLLGSITEADSQYLPSVSVHRWKEPDSIEGVQTSKLHDIFQRLDMLGVSPKVSSFNPSVLPGYILY